MSRGEPPRNRKNFLDYIIVLKIISRVKCGNFSTEDGEPDIVCVKHEEFRRVIKNLESKLIRRRYTEEVNRQYVLSEYIVGNIIAELESLGLVRRILRSGSTRRNKRYYLCFKRSALRFAVNRFTEDLGRARISAEGNLMEDPKLKEFTLILSETDITLECRGMEELEG